MISGAKSWAELMKMALLPLCGERVSFPPSTVVKMVLFAKGEWSRQLRRSVWSEFMIFARSEELMLADC